MVKVAPMLIIGDEQKRVVPRWPVAQGVVDVMNQLFAGCYVVIGMLAIAASAKTGL